MFEHLAEILALTATHSDVQRATEIFVIHFLRGFISRAEIIQLLNLCLERQEYLRIKQERYDEHSRR